MFVCIVCNGEIFRGKPPHIQHLSNAYMKFGRNRVINDCQQKKTNISVLWAFPLAGLIKRSDQAVLMRTLRYVKATSA